MTINNKKSIKKELNCLALHTRKYLRNKKYTLHIQLGKKNKDKNRYLINTIKRPQCPVCSNTTLGRNQQRNPAPGKHSQSTPAVPKAYATKKS